MREAGTWPRTNSVSGATIHYEVTVQQKNTRNGSYIKAARTISHLLSMVPLTMKHKNSSKKVKSFPMLKNCSQGTFLKEDLLKNIEVW